MDFTTSYCIFVITRRIPIDTSIYIVYITVISRNRPSRDIFIKDRKFLGFGESVYTQLRIVQMI